MIRINFFFIVSFRTFILLVKCLYVLESVISKIQKFN